MRRLLILGVVAAVAVGGFVVASRSSGPKFDTFRDRTGGFSVTYPAEWIAHAPKDPNLRLFLQVKADSADSATFRVDETQSVVNPADLVYVKSFTDAVISGSHPNVAQHGAVTLNGLSGYYYRYTITDASSGQTLIHFHYFVFQGHKMFSFVLQAVPADLAANSGRLATQFDQIRASFQGSA
ncbi:MAG: hypothetical protein M3N98_14020 [Actinomycetota bacterium]|nr:hypothetical protein [Actinomycetota bacterium]